MSAFPFVKLYVFQLSQRSTPLRPKFKHFMFFNFLLFLLIKGHVVTRANQFLIDHDYEQKVIRCQSVARRRLARKKFQSLGMNMYDISDIFVF
jgi:hypothetical protein